MPDVIVLGYLEADYLIWPYNSEVILHGVYSQVERVISTSHAVKSQVTRVYPATHTVFTEVERLINTSHAVQSEIDRVRAHLVYSEIEFVLYNATHLRVLYLFPSRGDGSSWIANSTMPGDFLPDNLNTDVVEQQWRSNTGDKVGVELTCDTNVGQGVFVDTLAILNHNLTTSATLIWQMSMSPAFASSESLNISVTLQNIYWIAPTLPPTSYRYHRFIIDDNTNPADYLSIGTIIFGSSTIMQGDQFANPITKRPIHFSDKIRTEGYTNVSNDRALKYAITLNFRNIVYNSGNYQRLQEIIAYCRTSLKALWIPTPQYPSRFAVFAKLSEIPQEEHNDLGETHDYIDMTIELDESQ